jgi:membrane dipeptidase
MVGGVLVVGVGLAIAIPLTLNGRDGEAKQSWLGSEVLDEVPLVDGHNDLPWNLYRMEKNQLENFNLDANLKLHPVWGASSR